MVGYEGQRRGRGAGEGVGLFAQHQLRVLLRQILRGTIFALKAGVLSLGRHNDPVFHECFHLQVLGILLNYVSAFLDRFFVISGGNHD